MTLKDRLRGVETDITRKRVPLWEGPCGQGPNGGITFSLLNKFLNCRERFRVITVEGLRAPDAFNHRPEYGNMWHLCEETLGKHGDNKRGRQEVEIALTEYCRALAAKYPLQAEEVDKWYNVCKIQFPIYVEYWKKHPDETERKSLLQEKVFDVPYTLPSGRVVRLRGKWDGVDLIGKGNNASLFLFEHKTKGEIDPLAMRRQLSFDCQTMLYLVALTHFDWTKEFDVMKSSSPLSIWSGHGGIGGVRYNVIRRPLSGGKGSIVRHKAKGNKPAETKAAYYSRLGDIIRSEPDYFFYRWRVGILPQDINRFRQRFLDPVLENLCMWWENQEYCLKTNQDPFGPIIVDGALGEQEHVAQYLHWQHPFGCVNTLDEYGHSDLDAFLENGTEAGLVRANSLFGELQG